MTEVTLHLDGDPVVKERDFYQAKLKEANERIRSLEYDNAELVKRAKELSERVRYMASNPPRRPRRSNYVRH